MDRFEDIIAKEICWKHSAIPGINLGRIFDADDIAACVLADEHGSVKASQRSDSWADNYIVIEENDRLVVVWQTPKNDHYTKRPWYMVLRVSKINPAAQTLDIKVEDAGFFTEVAWFVTHSCGHFLRALSEAYDSSAEVYRKFEDGMSE